jgi:hypothetical protein
MMDRWNILKKSGALLFVLMANILLVSHSIFPHQHYGGFAWIPAAHHKDHHHPAGIHTEDCDHKHQDHDHDQSCLLSQAYLVPVNSSRLDCPVTDPVNQHLDFQLLFTDPNASASLVSFQKIPLPPLITHGRYPLPVTCCSGLRAPPTL